MDYTHPFVEEKMHCVVKIFRTELLAHGDKARAVGQSKYLKNVVKCYGFKSKELDDCLKLNILVNPKVQRYLNNSTERYLDLGIELFKSQYWEEKECAIRLLNTRIKSKAEPINELHLKKLEELILDKNHINNWATCDSFCNRITKVMLEHRLKRGMDTDKILALLQEWNRSEIGFDSDHTNWKQRISCVTFICLVRRNWFVETCYNFVNHVIHHSNERFVQLGAGWLMRELSTIDEKRTIDLLYTHYDSWNRESLRYAIEKLPTTERKKLLDYSSSTDDVNIGNKKRKRDR